MTLAALTSAAAAHQLAHFGALHTTADDNLGSGTIVLLGPDEPGFWPYVTGQPEFQDGASDPMDRWSTRIITNLAKDVGGQPLFPFGQPARPFIGWALRSGAAFVSPVALLVHAKAGLFVSYRGAVLLPEVLDLPPSPANPCDTCDGQPCLAACPVSALGKNGYDLPACHTYLDSADGKPCMSQGCAVRRSCPLGQDYPRLHAQSEFHMKEFHK